MPETQVVQVQCPHCGTQFQVPVRSIIDVGHNPELRQAFLSGQINVAVCPNCKQGGVLDVPLVYHDPAAEFLAVYFPPQLDIPEIERQKMIGEMTQSLMNSLPPDQRKGYFLSPHQFISRQNLIDAVLGTMGISQEELNQQREKIRLVEQLRAMADDPKGLEMMIEGKDDKLDYEFFLILSNMLDQAQAAGDAKTAQQLQSLREGLMKITTWGKRAAKQDAAVASLKDMTTPEQLLDKLVNSDRDEIDAMAIAGRPLLDYTFFEKLTERIEASSGAERDRLSELREHLLEVTQKLDEAARAQVNEMANLLKELLEAPNPRTAVREHAGEIDDTFMAVLSLNMQEAERRGDKAMLERLQMLYGEIMAVIDESMPPEVRLINDLLRAPYPEGTRALLKERRELITPEVLSLMERIADDMAKGGDEESIETVKRLRDIKAQAMLLV